MNFNSLFSSTVKTGSVLINYQVVRWRRPKKPFWLGIAKSKICVVPQPRVIRTPEEKFQWSILNENHRTRIDSLLNFIRNNDPKLENSFTQLNTEGKTIYSASLKAEISRSLENNSIWNAESARRREERMIVNKEKFVGKALEMIAKKDQRKKEKMEMIEEVVRKEKLLSASYVTPENLDKAIEDCLDNVVNYDFAIDLQGNRYPGRESLSPQSISEKLGTMSTP